MLDAVAGVVAKQILDAASLKSRSSPELENSFNSVSPTPQDVINIRKLDDSRSEVKTGSAQTVSLIHGNSVSPADQLVTFTINYPGGGGITTTLSAADFEAALGSSDRNSLGSESSSDGSSYSNRDVLRAALGLDPLSPKSPLPPLPKVASSRSQLDNEAVDFKSDALVASTLLIARDAKSDVEAVSDNKDAARVASLVSGLAAGPIGSSLSGSRSGVAFSITFTTVAVDPVKSGSANNGVDIKV